MTEPYQPLHKPIGVTLRDVADEMDERLWDYSLRGGDAAVFRGFRIFAEDEPPQPGLLYVLTGSGSSFPLDRLPYISCEEQPGDAAHLCVAGRETREVLDMLSQVFQRFRDLEADLNWLLGTGGSLEDLCKAASSFFRNPVYIHDSMFAVLAQSCRVAGMLELERDLSRGRSFVPAWLIEDFRFSACYAETLHQEKAAVWGVDQYPHHMRSLYVNLRDGDCYRGRLIVNELRSPLRPGDFRVAEAVAEYALRLLRRVEREAGPDPKSCEDVLRTLLSEGSAGPLEQRVLLTTLGWEEDDAFLAVLLKDQDGGVAACGDGALRSVLPAALPGVYPVFFERRLCVLADLRAARTDDAGLRARLAPFVRDFLLYAGASAEVEGLRALPAAVEQAGFALERAFASGGLRWYVSFSDCALSYLLSHIQTPFPLAMQLSPVLARLRRHDRLHGSQYYETLRCYLTHERSVPRTAEALIIHRTTLLYRLEKIAALTRLDLDDDSVRLYLLLSFRLSEELQTGR